MIIYQVRNITEGTEAYFINLENAVQYQMMCTNSAFNTIQTVDDYDIKSDKDVRLTAFQLHKSLV